MPVELPSGLNHLHLGIQTIISLSSTRNRTPSQILVNGDFWLIEDPQEARQIIQEAGLREAGQKEAPSGAEIAKMLEEKGLK